MDDVIVSCLLLLLANIPAPIKCDGRPVARDEITETSRRKGPSERPRCYRTALCETCSQSQVRCYEDSDLSPLIAKKFKADFCGHHGVVLVDKKSGRLQNLLPLECSHGICPDQSECKKNPADGVSYCCSLEKLDGSESGRSNSGAARDSTIDDPTDIHGVDSDDEVEDIPHNSLSHKPSSADVLKHVIILDSDDDIPETTTSIVWDVEEVKEISANNVYEKLSSSESWTLIISTDPGDVIAHRNLEDAVTDVFSSSTSPSNIISRDLATEAAHKNPNDVVSEAFPLEFSTTLEIAVDTFFPDSTSVNEAVLAGTTCEILELSSDGVAEKRFLDSSGRPVTVAAMDVIDWYSPPCRKGVTFTFSESVVRVTGGCRGHFRVCYLNNTDPEEETTTPQVPIDEQECQNVTLQSKGNGRALHPLTDINNRIHIVSMELVKQLSTVQCIQWLNYYSEGSVALAKDGCSGEFEVCYLENVTLTPVSLPEPAGKTCRLITLSSGSSREGQRVVTNVRGENVTIRNMTLARQISQTVCIEGTTFSFHGSTAVSREGCIGTFQICYDAVDLHTTTPEGEFCDTEVTLSSNISHHGEHNHKLTDAHGTTLAVQTMTLLKQFSEVQCVAGHSYFFVGPTAFALDGCTGTFKVCYNISGSERERSAVAVTAPGGDQHCMNVKLTSRLKVPVNKTFIDSGGRPLPIISVHRVEQISKVACVEGATFKLARYVLRVFGGCKAIFQVCVGTPDEAMTTPAEVISTPVEDMTTPDEVMTTTVDDMTTPVDDMTTPLEVMTTPVEVMTTPVKVITTPVDDMTTPVDDMTTPVEVMTTPVEVITTPVDDMTTPVDDMTTPVDVMTTPVEVMTTPVEVMTTPVDDMTTPVEVITTPVEVMTTPVEVMTTPVEVMTTPVEVMTTPVEVMTTPVEVMTTPVDDMTTPVDDMTTPVEVMTTQAEDMTTAATPTCSNESRQQCETVKLMSRFWLPVKKTFVDSEGNPLPIISVQLVEQISTVECAEGVTFKVRRYRLRVFGGCKAVFHVCVDTPVEDMTNPSTSTDSTAFTEECVNVTLRSRPDKTKASDVRNNDKNPVRIVHAEVLTQISYVPCIKGQNYHYHGSILRASDGCSAVFKICYSKKGR